jgi:hypothetical protein
MSYKSNNNNHNTQITFFVWSKERRKQKEKWWIREKRCASLHEWAHSHEMRKKDWILLHSPIDIKKKKQRECVCVKHILRFLCYDHRICEFMWVIEEEVLCSRGVLVWFDAPLQCTPLHNCCAPLNSKSNEMTIVSKKKTKVHYPTSKEWKWIDKAATYRFL